MRVCFNRVVLKSGLCDLDLKDIRFHLGHPDIGYKQLGMKTQTRYATRSNTTFEVPTPAEESLGREAGDLNLSQPAFAHNVQTSGNVASLFHLEPNHNPRAGEPAKVWFALTKQGGEEIPLDQCNCQITVYENQKVISQPPLNPLKAEKYQGLPSAAVLFPRAGLYKVEIKGQPKQENAFDAFQFAYEVTVQPGQPGQAVAAVDPTNPLAPTDPVLDLPGMLIWTPLVAIVAGSFWLTKRRNK